MGFGNTHERYNIRESTVEFAACSSRGGSVAVCFAGKIAPVLPRIVSYARVYRRAEGLLQQMANGTKGDRLRFGSIAAESMLPRDLDVHVSRDHERHPHQVGEAEVHGRRQETAVALRGGREEDDRVESGVVREPEGGQVECGGYVSVVETNGWRNIRRFSRQARSSQATMSAAPHRDC